jgi:hypothetical protein
LITGLSMAAHATRVSDRDEADPFSTTRKGSDTPIA